MFDIKIAMQKWRRNFEGSEHFSQKDIDEMEYHLIDGIDELKKENLSEEEAFLVAVHRLGKPETLEEEFQKVHPNRVWQNRIIWMLTGFLLVLSIKAIIGLVSKLFVFGSSFITTNFLVLYILEISIIGIAVLLMIWLMYKFFFTNELSIEKFLPVRLKLIHYTIIGILVSVGQILPEYLRHWMREVHHDTYWEIWSEYGGYLTNIFIAEKIINFSFPLVLLALFIILNHSYKSVKD